MGRKVRQSKMTLGKQPGHQTAQIPGKVSRYLPGSSPSEVFQHIVPPARKYLSAASPPGLCLLEAAHKVPQTKQEDKALQNEPGLGVYLLNSNRIDTSTAAPRCHRNSL